MSRLIGALIIALRIVALMAIAVGLLARARGGDINKGYTFSPNEKNVTHTKLNGLVDGASINSTFFTDKSASTTLAAGDVFLMYQGSSGQYRKLTADTLLFSNTLLITGAAEKTALATNDFVLMYSTADSAYRKFALNSLFAAVPDLVELTNIPQPTLQFEVNSNGVPMRIGYSNLFAEWWRWSKFNTNGYPTNTPLMSLHTHPTNLDLLLIWDAVNSTNKATTLLGLVTNLPAASSVTTTDVFLMVSYPTNANNPYATNPTISKVAAQTFRPAQFTTNAIVIPLTANNFTATHGFLGIPQYHRWVLVCTNSDAGYAVGDEVPVENFFGSVNKEQFFSFGASATAVFLSQRNGVGAAVTDRTDGNLTTITGSKWNAKCYATYLPP